MASNREREESLTFTIPSSSSHSSPITVSDQLDSYLADPRSASGSFQNDGLLSSGDASAADPDFGFSRPDFRQSPLAGTVEFYQRHVFLCYKNPRVWPPRIEAAEFDRLPRLLHAAVVARKSHMKKEVLYYTLLPLPFEFCVCTLFKVIDLEQFSKRCLHLY